jgi:hypothetical protein
MHSHPPGKASLCNSFDRFLFPERSWITFAVIGFLSIGISFLLIGKQVFYANWGMIDDSEIYTFLGQQIRLPLSDFFYTLLNMTEVGHPGSGRFRPSYYFLKLLETSTWGTNIHLWYLARTLWFAVFIASLWWILSRFLQVWLGAALLLPILVLPFWADVWARLGPSEAYGTLALGLMLGGICGTIELKTVFARSMSAVLVTLAAVILIGAKETFVPLAGAALGVLLFAGVTKKVSVWIAAGSILVICAYSSLVIFAMKQSVLETGTDFYANKIEIWRLLNVGLLALGSALVFKGIMPAYAATLVISGCISKWTRPNSREWIISSCAIVVIFCFMALVFFTQNVFYRGELPTQTRYDFPASLFTPFSYLALVCYAFYGMHLLFSSRVVNYASIFLASAVFTYYLPAIASTATWPLARAVDLNIQKTNEFFHTMQAIAATARQSPNADIVLEAYGPGAYEPVYSVLAYVRSLGANNSMAVRLHPSEKSYGVLYDGLEKQIRDWQDHGNDRLVPLSKAKTTGIKNCISVGINGIGDADCMAYEVKT